MRVRRGHVLMMGGVIALGTAGLVACDQWVALSTARRVHASAADVPARDVALVLGTRPVMPDGRGNLYFEGRMDAAAALYAAGKVRQVLVSGDNHVKEYDETSAMRDALVERGVPSAAITLDYAGFGTLDSVVRAKEVFRVTRMVVVSQAFHDERALFIADRAGIDAVAVDAPGAGSAHGVVMRLREVLARTRAVMDLYVLGTRPHFAGPPEPIVLGESKPVPTAGQ